MATENQATYEDMMELISRPSSPNVWQYTAELVLENESIPLTQVLSFTEMADYEKLYSAALVLQAKVGKYTYSRSVYPNRDNLKIKILKVRRSDNGSSSNFGESSHQTYAASLVNPIDVDALSTSRLDTDSELSELSNQMTVSFQLSDTALRECRTSTNAGIFRDESMKDVFRYLMGVGLDGSQTKEMLESPTFYKVRGVDVVEPANPRTQKLIIPVGSEILDIPSLIQNLEGVYTTGLGYFLQDGIWYIYPLYDHTQFSKRKKTLTVINLAEDEVPQVDTTFKVEDTSVTICAIGKTEVVDQSESLMHNNGNGIKFIRPSGMLDKWFSVSNNKVTMDVSKTLKEVSIAERKDGIQNSMFDPKVLTVNPCVSLSKLSRGLGRVVTVQWPNSDNKLLYPGMPVKFLYMKGTEVRESFGTLLSSNTQVSTRTTALTDTEFTSHTQLSIFLSNEST